MRLQRTAMAAALTLLLSLGGTTVAGATPGGVTPAGATPPGLTAPGVTASASTAPGAGPSSESGARVAGLLETADRLMGMRYWDFAGQPQVAPFDWETDGCTGVDTGSKIIFYDACVQHDFGYGNYGPSSHLKLDPSDARRAWIDERFHHEMRQICIDRHGGSSTCLGSAKVIYDGVRLLGHWHW
ncbi:phospholipase A2 [Streptomyces sp. cmx-18-6]|uniref:phospholipase A2 n=1 Tax=Streptomyces sp. cmx-18-6 TaxID=2790930 RepID=UPI0039809966